MRKLAKSLAKNWQNGNEYGNGNRGGGGKGKKGKEGGGEYH